MRLIAPALLHLLHSRHRPIFHLWSPALHLHSRPVEATFDAGPSQLTMDVSIRSTGSSFVKADARGGSSHATPKELLYSSLCTCTLATLETFIANSRSLSQTWAASGTDLIDSVEAMEVMDDVRDEHIPASIDLAIKLRKDNGLTREQRDRLLMAASFCPVKRMLNPNIKISVSIV